MSIFCSRHWKIGCGGLAGPLQLRGAAYEILDYLTHGFRRARRGIGAVEEDFDPLAQVGFGTDVLHRPPDCIHVAGGIRNDVSPQPIELFRVTGSNLLPQIRSYAGKFTGRDLDQLSKMLLNAAVEIGEIHEARSNPLTERIDIVADENETRVVNTLRLGEWRTRRRNLAADRFQRVDQLSFCAVQHLDENRDTVLLRPARGMRARRCAGYRGHCPVFKLA